MRARDPAVEYPPVRLDSDALDAARLPAGQRLPGVPVMDDDGEPYALLPASALVELPVPGHVIEDPTPVVVDEPHADRLCQAPAGRPVADCPPGERRKPPIADADDTALEVAALMARERGPLIAVVEREPDRERGGSRLPGVTTAAHLLERLLGVT
ncbi:hypothetical protein AB0E27_32185 [Streptomyces sparsogenes]|uniref:hypothetical protein n=1 Tax=Streptomyces sparsogenes TaxID=67365 RepID=UPI0033E772D3